MNKVHTPYPGPTPNAPTNNTIKESVTKDPYQRGRFKPEKKINDPIILVFFILQVCDYFVSMTYNRATCSSLDSWPCLLLPSMNGRKLGAWEVG